MSIALVGLGGYGHIYVNALLGNSANMPFKLVAGVDPVPEGCSRLGDLQERSIPIFSSLDEFLESGRADLIVLSTPLHLHCEQTCAALAHGAHVLCEKPLGAHPKQVRQMMEARDRHKRQVSIGYQWSFSPAVLELKRDISAGRFGHPRRLRTRVYWPRDEKYYKRGSWAGRQRDSQDRWVLDSPANNACAHYLHNMFYVLGDAVDRSDWPATVQAELYRANEIENYDTIALRCRTQRGAEIMFLASHATRHGRDPQFCYEFESGTVRYGGKLGDTIIAELPDGSLVNYGSPAPSDSPQKLFDTMESLRSLQPVVCGPEAAGAQTACVYAAQQSMATVVDFPPEMVRVEGKPGERRTHVKNLEKVLDECYDRFSLPSEIGLVWAKAGREVAVAAQVSPSEPSAKETGPVLQSSVRPVRGVALSG
jgi:predicted dehydrogenase